jgi:hypothetical protein
MPALFAAWKYKSLAIFSVIGTVIFGLVASYFYPHLDNDFFAALFLFGGSSLILSVVLSFEDSLPSQEVTAEKNHSLFEKRGRAGEHALSTQCRNRQVPGPINTKLPRFK